MNEFGFLGKDEIAENDRLATLVQAFMLIWTGFIVLAGFQQWLAEVPLPSLVWFPFLRKWLIDFEFDFRVIPLIFLGNAGFLFLELLVRLAVPRLRHSLTSVMVFIFLFVGLTLGSYGFFDWIVICPGIMIAIGVAIILGLIFRKKHRHK